MFKASIVEAAAWSCEQKVVGAYHGNLRMTEAIKLKEEAFWAWFAQRSLEAADRYQEDRMAGGYISKNPGVGRVLGRLW